MAFMNHPTGEEDEQETLSEINVTPMVDVMLVLLTIFMVTAPMMKAGIDLELPEAAGRVVEVQERNSLTIQILSNGKIRVNERYVSMEELKGILKNARGREIFIEGDKRVPYGTVARVLALCRHTGVTSLNLVTEETFSPRQNNK